MDVSVSCSARRAGSPPLVLNTGCFGTDAAMSDANQTTSSLWPCRASAALLIVAAAGLHLAYLANNCPLDLAPDEAHYWDWSRHPDWSYYSKGPLVAYLIRLGTLLAGSGSPLFPNEMVAVRLPAIVCGSLLLASLYILTVQVFHREKLALAVVALALTLPMVSAGSSLITIDSPYTCCWAWALVLGHRAWSRDELIAWLLTGLLVGLGILAKYTMVLWLPSVGLFLLTSSRNRGLLLQRGFWVMVLMASVCCVPILVWNFQHNWVTFRHVGGQAGVHQPIHWLGPLNFVGVQFALLLGFWFVAWVAALSAHPPWKESDPGIRYLWWMSTPMFATFLLFGFKTGGGEPNWPVTAYLSGLVLAAAWVARQLGDPRAWYRRLTAGGLATACVLGILLTLLMHFSVQAQPVLLRLSGAPTPSRPMPLRRIDPTCRLRGWAYLGDEVDRVRTRLRNEGVEPLLAANSWSLPGELGFYCEGHPTVYSLGLALGDRWSQYDFWRPNPVLDPEVFRGRDVVFVGNMCPALQAAFDYVEPPIPVHYRERGQLIAGWAVIVCRGYRGFPTASAAIGKF